MQNPNITKVASYNDWQKKFERKIIKGEKGLKIFVPIKIKKEEVIDGKGGKEEKIEKEVLFFKIGHVFDISQTSGKKLLRLEIKKLTGEIKDYERLKKAIMNTSKAPIKFEEIENNEDGYYLLDDKKIAIKKELSEKHTIKTMLHEIAHSEMHEDKMSIQINNKSEDIIELEAEGVSYIVSKNYKIDTSEYSFKYLAAFSKNDKDKILNSFDLIKKTSENLIKKIDNELEKNKNKEKNQK